VPPETEGLAKRLARSMSQVDSRYNGCVIIGALRARSCRAATLAALSIEIELVMFTDAVAGAAHPLVASLRAPVQGGIWHVLQCPA
jgi:hypothetical protein